jgi:hypothetical protein
MINMDVVQLMPKCPTCKWYYGHREGRAGLTCKAYPEGIPSHIIQGEIVHDKPYPGDNGIMYEPANRFKSK